MARSRRSIGRRKKRNFSCPAAHFRSEICRLATQASQQTAVMALARRMVRAAAATCTTALRHVATSAASLISSSSSASASQPSQPSQQPPLSSPSPPSPSPSSSSAGSSASSSFSLPGPLRERLWTVPNAITVTRLALTPVIGHTILQGEYATSLWMLAAAGASDWVSLRLIDL